METTTINADPVELLRPFVELAMDPDYQARRLAEEAKQQKRKPA